VLEVDHPATQRYKRARIAGHRPRARDVGFVPIDFEREALDDALARGGHAEAEATLWLWEGVTPYLGIDAVRATLGTIQLRSAARSRLVVTYGTPNAAGGMGGLTRAARACFRAFGEPLRGLLAREEMHAELARAGLRVLEDTSPHDWAARYGDARGRILLVGERMVVAGR
jgi:methyltransferase (TIGR00027 family)